MKTLLELFLIYVLAVLLNALLSWILGQDFTEAGTVRIFVIWYTVEWIKYRDSVTDTNEGSK